MLLLLWLCIFSPTLVYPSGQVSLTEQNESVAIPPRRPPFQSSPRNSVAESSESIDDLINGTIQSSVDHYSHLMLRRAYNANRNGNFIQSAFGLTISMAMLYLGSAGLTKKQIAKMLLDPDMDSRYHEAFFTLLDRLKKDSSAASALHIGNIILLRDTFAGRTSLQYQESVKSNYAARIRYENFSSNKTGIMQSVNSEISEITNQMIPEFLAKPFNPDTTAVILNALSFDGAWESQFKVDESNTFQNLRRFQNSDGTMSEFRVLSAVVPSIGMIHEKSADRDNDVRVYEYNYQGNMSLCIAQMTNEATPIANLFENYPKVLKYVRGKKPIRTNALLYLPKLELKSRTNLNGFIQQRGVKNLFNRRANISDIVPNSYLQNVVQACAMQIDADNKSTKIPKPRTRAEMLVVVNRPFLFFVYDKSTQTILFEGFVNKVPHVESYY